MSKLSIEDLKTIDKYLGYYKQEYNSTKQQYDSKFYNWLDGHNRYMRADYRYNGRDIPEKYATYEAKINTAKKKGQTEITEKNGETRIYKGDSVDITEHFKTTKVSDLEGEFDDVKKEAQALKNDYNAKRLATYIFAKEKIASHGGFWKSLFTFNIGRYFKEKNALAEMKNDLNKEGFTDKMLDTLTEPDGLNVSETIFDGLDEDGQYTFSKNPNKNSPKIEKNDISLGKQIEETIKFDEKEVSTSKKVDDIQISIINPEKSFDDLSKK